MNRDSGITAELNETQRAAVEHGKGSLLIVAGPGSGKTRVVASRIAHLIRVERVAARDIMAVTFTNRAAGEMRERVWRLLDGVAEGIKIGTFHAFCASTLRRFGGPVGVLPKYSICDREDQMTALREALWAAAMDERGLRPGDVLAAISRAKSELLDAEAMMELARDETQQAAARARPHYDRILAAAGALDFDDLLGKTLQLLALEGEAFERTAGRLAHVLVDEFQDTNVVQYQLTQVLSSVHGNVTAVGDPDQSIYSWRAADVRNMRRFAKEFEGTEVVLLDQNYRSSAHILEASRALISAAPGRRERTLWTSNAKGDPVALVDLADSRAEARFVSGEIERNIRESGRRFSDFAVMYRANAQSREIERACVQAGLPYRITGGTRFYERSEIRDVLAWLRLIHNEVDGMAFRRAISAPPSGVGRTSVERLTRSSDERGVGLLELARAAVEQNDPELPARVRTALAGFVSRRDSLADAARALPTSELVAHVFSESGLAERFAQERDAADRLENVNELIAAAVQYNELEPEEGLAMFLEDAMLSGGGDDVYESGTEEALTLSTLHAAKGLEFTIVFMLGLEEGLLPLARLSDDPEQLEEERRVCYVGMTRAKERLYLTRARNRFNPKSGADGPTTASRFLEGLPAQGLLRLSDAAAGGAPAPAARRGVSAGASPARRMPGAFDPMPTPDEGEAEIRREYASGDPVWQALHGEGEVVISNRSWSSVWFDLAQDEITVATASLSPIEMQSRAAA